jgi:hypothetical protein
MRLGINSQAGYGFYSLNTRYGSGDCGEYVEKNQLRF